MDKDTTMKHLYKEQVRSSRNIIKFESNCRRLNSEMTKLLENGASMGKIREVGEELDKNIKTLNDWKMVFVKSRESMVMYHTKQFLVDSVINNTLTLN